MDKGEEGCPGPTRGSMNYESQLSHENQPRRQTTEMYTSVITALYICTHDLDL